MANRKPVPAPPPAPPRQPLVAPLTAQQMADYYYHIQQQEAQQK